MIKSREDDKLYLEQDRIALGKNYKYPKIIGDEIWRFQKLLRKAEYYKNTSNKNIIKKFFSFYYQYKYYKRRLKLGISIPLNIFEEGLSIAHYGTIVVNGNAKIGKNCRIQEGVTIGATNGSEEAPILGNNIFIGSGAKIIGNIKIADDVTIGANACVVKSIEQKAITVGGVPAKKISNNSSHSNLNKLLIENDLLK